MIRPRFTIRTLRAAVLVCVAACSRQASEDHTQICTQQCDQAFECELENNPYPTISECIDDCNDPEGLLWKYEDCHDAAEAMTQCLAELSCEELLAHHADLPNSPCLDPTEEFALCRAQHSP